MSVRRPASLVLLSVALPFAPAAFTYDGHDPWDVPRSPWTETAAHDGIVYLVDAEAPRIERYDMNATTWLEPLELPGVATAFLVDESGVIVANGRSLYAALPHATTFDFVTNTLGDVRSLASGGTSLYVSTNGRPNATVRDRSTGALVESHDYFYSLQGMVVADDHGLLVGRSSGISPSDIVSVDLASTDDWQAQADSPYHGDYPGATELHLFPDGNRVLDDAGMVYSLPDLVWLGSTAGEVRGVTFESDGLHVLSGNVIRKLSNDYLERGSRPLDGEAHALFGRGDDLFAFGRTADDVTTVDVVPKASVNDAALASVDPSAVTFRADRTFGTDDGSVFVLSDLHRSLFRRPAGATTFDHGVPLRGAPSSVARVPGADVLYLGYPSGAITRLDLASGDETAFANLAGTVHGVVPFEGGLFASDASGAWGSFHTFDESGTPLDSDEWHNPVSEPLWIGATREVLSTDNDRLVGQSIALDGSLGEERESGYDSAVAYPPLVSNPDRTRVLSGAGTIFDTASFELVGTLANGIVDAVWPTDERIVSLAREEDHYWYWYEEGSTERTTFRLQTWGENNEPLAALSFDAVDASLVESGGRASLIVLDSVPNRPRILEIDPDADDADADGVVDAADAYPLDPERSEPEPEPVVTDPFDPWAEYPTDEEYPTDWYLVTDEDDVTDWDLLTDEYYAGWGSLTDGDDVTGRPPLPETGETPWYPQPTDVGNGPAPAGTDAPDAETTGDGEAVATTDAGETDEPATVEVEIPDTALAAANELSDALENGGAGGTGGVFLALLGAGGVLRRRRPRT